MLPANELRRLLLSKLMAKRSLRRLATLLSVTAQKEAAGMMSSRCAAPHHGSGCVTSPHREAEYMAATAFPSQPTDSLASGLGPYMTQKSFRSSS